MVLHVDATITFFNFIIIFVNLIFVCLYAQYGEKTGQS